MQLDLLIDKTRNKNILAVMNVYTKLHVFATYFRIVYT